MPAPLDVSAAIRAVAIDANGEPTVFQITRQAAATIDGNGRIVPGAITTQDIVASVQPKADLATAENRAPAGAWATDRLEVFGIGLTTPFQCSDPTRRADRITYDGKVYEVSDALGWDELGGYSTAIFRVVDPRMESP